MEIGSTQVNSWTMSDISKALNIGPNFLLVSEVKRHGIDSYQGRARAPVSLPLDSHFINDPIVPASIIVEFALQFSAFVIARRLETKSTPIIGDIRYRALNPASNLENLSVVLDQFRPSGNGVITSSSIFDHSIDRIGSASFAYSVS